MTLTDFLLARIAEDEVVAREAQRDDLAFSSVPPYAKLGFAAGDLARTFRPARVLAECEAKRRAVGYLSEWPGNIREAAASELVLRLLSLPYADHPDYDPSWKP